MMEFAEFFTTAILAWTFISMIGMSIRWAFKKWGG